MVHDGDDGSAYDSGGFGGQGRLENRPQWLGPGRSAKRVGASPSIFGFVVAEDSQVFAFL